MIKAYRDLYPKRVCPICQYDEGELIYEQSFSKLSSESLLDGYDVVVCGGCGFGFADHIPHQRDFDLYYSIMSKYEYQDSGGKESPFDLARFEVTADLIVTYLAHTEVKILDVGCATGGLLNQLRRKGFPNVIGLDPSLACAEAAWRQYGIRVLTKTISQLNEIDERFDLVILSGVLEHIRDLETHLSSIYNILEENGKVLVVVPDASRFDCFPDAPYQQFSMEHINFFSPVSLCNLMSRNKYRTVSAEQMERQHGHGAVNPVVFAIFERCEAEDFASPGFTRCTKTGKALKNYVRLSDMVERNIHKVIDELVDSGRPVMVWGVGTHTLRLMETSNLARANIVAFIDTNPHYQNKQLRGISVIAPVEILKHSEAILVSSRVFQANIVDQIRNELHAQNELILLYAL